MTSGSRARAGPTRDTGPRTPSHRPAGLAAPPRLTPAGRPLAIVFPSEWGTSMALPQHGPWVVTATSSSVDDVATALETGNPYDGRYQPSVTPDGTLRWKIL